MQNNNTDLIQREAIRLLDEDRLREALDFMYREAEYCCKSDDASPMQGILSDLADVRQDLETLHNEMMAGSGINPERYDRLTDRAYQLADRIAYGPATRRPDYYPQLMDDTQPLYIRCYLMSQLTFHLLKHFDAELTESLYLFTLDDQPIQLQVRAWVAIALVALSHRKRIEHNSRLQEQLYYIAETMHEREEANLMMGLQLLLLQSSDALRAKELLHSTIEQLILKYAKKNNGEETGGVIKMHKAKTGMGNVMSVSLNLNDTNNAWLHTAEGKQLRKKVAEYISLIGDGADSQLDAFEMASHTPFFQHHPDHWLAPFALDHPEVARVLHEKPEFEPMVRSILHSNSCDTDKFVHLGMLSSMDSQMLNILTLIKSQADEILQPQQASQLGNLPQPTSADAMRAYMHDLFRYCLYSGEVSDEDNPFKRPLFFLCCPWLQASIDHPEEMHDLGQNLLQKERWEEAFQVYDHLLKTDNQKKTFMGWYAAATHCDKPAHDVIGRLYQYAYLYPEDEKMQYFLGDMLAKESRWQEAELILRPAVQRWPENLDLRLTLAVVKTALGQYQEALDHLFHCEFIEENAKVRKAQAVVLLHLGRQEEAEKYIVPFIADSSCSDDDLILAGHIRLAMGDLPEAVSRYQRAWYKRRRNRKGQKLATFVDQIFCTPIDVRKAGISSTYIAIARDTLYNKKK